jgi:hypothetical protein
MERHTSESVGDLCYVVHAIPIITDGRISVGTVEAIDAADVVAEFSAQAHPRRAKTKRAARADLSVMPEGF